MTEASQIPEGAIIYLVDDDPAIRDSLAWLLSTRGLKCQVFESGEALLEALPLAPVSAIVLDMRMGGLSGLETFECLRKVGVERPVIFLTGHGDVPVAVEALKKGAADFIEKPFNDNQLVDTLIANLIALSQRVSANRETAAIEERLPRLSAREMDVLKLMVEGRLNKQIADDLSISMRTVEVHRARILIKMQEKNAVELAAQISNPIFGTLNSNRKR